MSHILSQLCTVCLCFYAVVKTVTLQQNLIVNTSIMLLPNKWKVNVNVYDYSAISPWVQQTSEFTPLALEFSLIRSHRLWGEFSTFSAANAIHNSPIFVPPGTHLCWVGRGSMEWEVCPTLLYITSSGNRALDLILSPTPYPLGHMLPWKLCVSFTLSSSLNCITVFTQPLYIFTACLMSSSVMFFHIQGCM